MLTSFRAPPREESPIHANGDQLHSGPTVALGPLSYCRRDSLVSNRVGGLTVLEIQKPGQESRHPTATGLEGRAVNPAWGPHRGYRLTPDAL